MAGAVVLLSGGLDSSVALAMEARRVLPRLALFVDYGQRAAAAERRASRAIAAGFGVDHEVVTLDFFRHLRAGALLDPTAALPRPAEVELDDARVARRTARAVWVPNRNGVLAEVAAAFAESLESDRIVLGFNAEEARTFPDNSTGYRQALTAALRLSTTNRVEVTSPTEELTKREILAAALSLDVPLEAVWPCYEDGAVPCGACESCRRMARAARQHGIRWPVSTSTGSAGSTGALP